MLNIMPNSGLNIATKPHTTLSVEHGQYYEEANQSEDNIIIYFTEDNVIDIAKVLYEECRGISSKTEQACVAWIVLNRIENDASEIHDIVRAPYQFSFTEDTPVWDNLYELAYDVLYRWNLEQNGFDDVGRVLPKSYKYFRGDGETNYFRNGFEYPYSIWDYSLESPYDS